ncbi:hypothetical protein HA45_09315 [Pantoea rodasii]|uniref:hypothetical protein n=1 Tax=Pantoea rodasii TaxID=1076549 RepID=UPI000A235887|nr:hypothetical protein [Pantoea rodasii]ORM64553.1 hypothetical protein HA45_09315 [Pantoea rodasii]
MSVYRDENGKYRTYADNTQEFDYADAAYRHERDLQAALHPQTDHASGGGGGGAGGIDISWDEFKTLIAFIGPVLVLYWLVAFPALNASWLLMNTPAPFSWIGSLLYTAWDLAVKVAGAPYYLAYFLALPAFILRCRLSHLSGFLYFPPLSTVFVARILS